MKCSSRNLLHKCHPKYTFMETCEVILVVYVLSDEVHMVYDPANPCSKYAMCKLTNWCHVSIEFGNEQERSIFLIHTPHTKLSTLYSLVIKIYNYLNILGKKLLIFNEFIK